MEGWADRKTDRLINRWTNGHYEERKIENKKERERDQLFSKTSINTMSGIDVCVCVCVC